MDILAVIVGQFVLFKCHLLILMDQSSVDRLFSFSFLFLSFVDG